MEIIIFEVQKRYKLLVYKKKLALYREKNERLFKLIYEDIDKSFEG